MFISMVLRILLLLISLFAGFEFSANYYGCHSRGQGPSVEYEVQRRRIESGTRGLRDYVAGQINRIVNITRNIEKSHILKAFFKHFNDRLSMLLLEQQRLWAVDGHCAWRGAEAAEVRALVQRRLYALQHPAHCTPARKLVCKLEQDSEFGCQIDTLVFCLALSYGTRRTLVLDSRGWRYHAQGWDRVFQPLSDNCTYYDSAFISSASSEDKVVIVTNVKDIAFRIGPFMPPTIPMDLVDRIVRFTGDPAAWWIGQLLAYILRPRQHLAATVTRTKHHIHYYKPIVGLHVRRTDKIEWGEMTFHPIEEYMFYAEYYYWTAHDLIHNTSARRVYLATEDPKVLSEARRKYPAVQFLSETAVLQSAARTRSQPSALPPLLTDITLLAAADFFVCTFTSHVSRLVYLMMQSTNPDALGAVHSLDQVFHLNVMRPFDRIALAYHTPVTADEMKLMPGDMIEVFDYAWPWDKYKYGFNQRTRPVKKGEFPWFKTKDMVRVYPLPTYAEVPLCDGEREGVSTSTPSGSSAEDARVPYFPTPLQAEALDDVSALWDDQYPDL